MADTGWVLAGAGVSVDPGNVAWTDPGNITDDTGTFAHASSVPKNGGSTKQLNATAFGFSIPAAQIVGVEAQVRRGRDTGANLTEHTIQLLIGGDLSGDNKADAGSVWGPAITTLTYGDPEDLWNAPLTPSQINAAGFGLAIRALNNSSNTNGNPRVYFVSMRIHYEEQKSSGAFFALFSVADRLKNIIKPRPRFWLPEPEFCR